MPEVDNPFTTHTYKGPDYFCDRNAELSRLIELFDNQRYGLLYSMRRMGKTGLIQHFHHTIRRRKDVVCVYCDVQSTTSDSAFVSKLISAVLAELEDTKQGFLERVGQFFTSLRPVVTFDPVTHVPAVQFNIQTSREAEISLSQLMTMLGDTPKRIQIALDEFQQITEYESTVIDATLRGYIEKAPNVHFLFCGSRQHILLGLFADARRPFFGTVEHMHLDYIDPTIYGDFIYKKFTEGGQKINRESVDEVLSWTRGHTFYTQYFCNRLFAKMHRSVEMQHVEREKEAILFSFEPSYFNFRSILSRNQFKLLRAIGREGEVTGVSAAAFLSRYDLAQSTAQQAQNALLDKELLYKTDDRDGSRIFVYDPFFSRWLEGVPAT